MKAKSNIKSGLTGKSVAKDQNNFLLELVAPARRALENAGITTLEKLSDFSEKEIMELHGMGPSTLPKLCKALGEKGLSFKD